MICVTGAGGAIGSEMIKLLESKEINFRAAYFSSDKLASARKMKIDAVEIDYNDSESLHLAFQECDKLFLLAPNVPNQIELELNAVDVAKAVGVKHIVKLSIQGAENEEFELAKTHRYVEQAIQSSGISWTFLRPSRLMQNIVTYMKYSITTESSLYSASGEGKISHVDARDVAAVALKTLISSDAHKGKAYTLTGSEALRYSDMANELSKALGRQITHISLSPSLWKGSLLEEGLPEVTIDHMLDLERYVREDASASLLTDSVEQLTGRKPRLFASYAQESKLLL